MPLFKYDPFTESLIDMGIDGTVDEDGTTATFEGVTDFSIFAGIARENQPPNCANATPSTDALWPPDHKFVPIEVLGVTDPDGDTISIAIDSIFQDEEVNARGSGKTSPDGKGVGDSIAQVRAERAGTNKTPGNGRVYHIFFTADDGYGGYCSGEVLVGVPHDKKDTPVDDGPLYDSTVVDP